MKNFVSAKTAKELKGLDFPQPEPEVGQVWYFDENGALVPYIITHSLGDWHQMASLGLKDRLSRAWSEGGFFAPTATDILAIGCILCKMLGDTFGVFPLNSRELLGEHENPAEAAALAFKAQKA